MRLHFHHWAPIQTLHRCNFFKMLFVSHSQGSVKQDNITSEVEIEEKEMEISKDDDSSEKPSEVCDFDKFGLLFFFIVPSLHLILENEGHTQLPILSNT